MRFLYESIVMCNFETILWFFMKLDGCLKWGSNFCFIQLLNVDFFILIFFSLDEVLFVVVKRCPSIQVYL